MRKRTRVLTLVAMSLVVLGSTGALLASRVLAERATLAAEPQQPVVAMSEVTSQPHITFRSTSRDSSYGLVAAVTTAGPDGPRAVAEVSCERLSSTAETTLCLNVERGVITRNTTLVLDDELRTVRELPLTGLPSRARLSPDGRLAATTTFVTGHSYAGSDFSTETIVQAVDGTARRNIQDFELVVDGETITADDRNLWGVTFADDDVFYATAATGGTTWLVRGSLADERLEALTEDAECPSLSPDGNRIVFKRRADAEPGRWRLAVRDLASGEERLLAEERSVDDQVEWLDDQHILYGLPREGTDAAISDVWRLDVDGDEDAEVMISEAWSPSVVR